MNRIFKKPQVYWLVGIFLVYLLADVLISQFYITLEDLPRYFATIHWGEFIVAVVFSGIIAFLVAVNAVFGYVRWQERRVAKEGLLVCAGGIGGFAAGVCPACVTSVFPFIFGIFGVSLSWASLPLHGFEIQILTIIVLGASLYLLSKK